jgi:hypothetical protein
MDDPRQSPHDRARSSPARGKLLKDAHRVGCAEHCHGACETNSLRLCGSRTQDYYGPSNGGRGSGRPNNC